MDERDFLRKAAKDGQLGIVDPSENIFNSYVHKSENSLKSADILLSSGLYENSAIEAYYAVYNSVTALLRKVGIKCENHAVAVSLLRTLFGEKRLEKIASEVRKRRLDFQYYVSHSATKDNAADTVSKSENLCSAIGMLARKLTSEKASELRGKLRGMLE